MLKSTVHFNINGRDRFINVNIDPSLIKTLEDGCLLNIEIQGKGEPNDVVLIYDRSRFKNSNDFVKLDKQEKEKGE